MAIKLLYSFFFFSLGLNAQYNNKLPAPITAGAQLLTVADNIILINSMDLQNGSHKWTTFDSTLAIISEKKLVTPDAKNIISQSYLQAGDSIVRVDQVLSEGVLSISAYVFDLKGNIKQQKQIESIVINNNKWAAVPFFVSQSPDKRITLLVQMLVSGKDNLLVSTITFDSELKIYTNGTIDLPYKSELFDLYMPLVNNDKTVIIPTAEKFSSYKLGTTINTFLLSPGESYRKMEFKIERKKLKGLNFNLTEDIYMFSGLYSDSRSRNDIAGAISKGFDLKTKRTFETKELAFTEEVKQELKKVYGSEGRKGNLLNYVSLLPAINFNNKDHYAILLPAEKHQKVITPSNAPPLPVADEVRQQVAYANSFVGTQPQGYARPMNAAEASTYAAIYGNNSPPYNNNQITNRNRSQGPIDKRRTVRNLLYFDNNKATTKNSYKFLKIKNADDKDYQFFKYLPGETGYGVMYYMVPSFSKPYLKFTKITKGGLITEKNVFEDKSKVLLPGYPSIINNESIIALYEDKLTREMGLIKIKL